MPTVIEQRENGRRRVYTVNDEASQTQQSDRHRAEMRHILSRYEKTGVLVDLREVELQYRDVSEFDDFTDIMRAGAEAKTAFMRLPSKVRELFNHDHFEWLDTAHDPEKLQALRPKLEKLGVLKELAPELLEPEVPPAPPAPPVTPPE